MEQKLSIKWVWNLIAILIRTLAYYDISSY